MSTQPSLFKLPQRDICAGKHGGNPESREAFTGIAPSLSKRRELVLDFVRNSGDLGATPDEIAEHFSILYGGNHNTWAPRCSELKEAGKIYASLERRRTRQGKYARVLRAVEP